MTSTSFSPSAYTPPVATGYRVWPVTRRRIDLQAQPLIKVNAVVAVVSLPLGILASFIVMRWQGVNANIMSLGGIAIAVGAMVDAAVVMIENATMNRK